MSKVLLVILLLKFSISFSQGQLNQQEIIQAFKSSPQLLDINLLLPNQFNGIQLNKTFANYNHIIEECPRLKFNEQENLKVINILEKSNLLDTIYSINKSGYFFNLKSNKNIKLNKQAKLYIELIFKNNKSLKADYYILIVYKRKIAANFINDLSVLTDEKKCFKNFKRKL